jgi:hypothetical protein
MQCHIWVCSQDYLNQVGLAILFARPVRLRGSLVDRLEDTVETGENRPEVSSPSIYLSIYICIYPCIYLFMFFFFLSALTVVGACFLMQCAQTRGSGKRVACLQIGALHEHALASCLERSMYVLYMHSLFMPPCHECMCYTLG